MNFPSFLFFLSRRLVTFLNFRPVFSILVSVFYSTRLYVCSTTIHGNIRGMWFSLMFVDLYFTPYITTKHNNNNGMRHETAWLDRMIDRTFHQNGLDGTWSSSSSYDWKALRWISLSSSFCFVSLLLSFFLVFYFVTGECYHAIIIDRNEGINSIPRCDAIVVSVVVVAAAATHAFKQQHSNTSVRTATLVRRDEGYRTWLGNQSIPRHGTRLG
jgi:hypothetical protein